MKNGRLPLWGIWTIGSFLALILLVFASLYLTKPKTPLSLLNIPKVETSSTPSQKMTTYQILDHASKTPHKQSFRVMIPGIVSESELVELTKQIAAKHRIGSELMLFNWWTSAQDPLRDDCWANSRYENDAITIRFLTDSEEQQLESVETRPLYIEGELGLWYWNRGETSHFIHVIQTDKDTVKVHTVFSDGSNAWADKRLKGTKPLEFLWSDADDEDQTYFEFDGRRSVLRSKDGVVNLEKVR